MENDEIDQFQRRIGSQPGVRCESVILGCARRLIRCLITEDDRLSATLVQFSESPFGCHGPGAVRDGSTGREKWLFDSIPGLPSTLYRSQHGYLKQSGADGEPSSKLAIVPKDFRGHRLICVEPKEFMFYQQGLLRVLTQLVHNHPLTKGCIDFRNQVKSQRLSRNSGFATIDLKDASDRVSLRLAKLLIPHELLSLATVARSRSVVLPDDEIEGYQTLFTMGNALCFPFETLIFWALTLATMLFEEHQCTLSEPDILSFLVKRRLRVFGDDIIVPRKYYDSVCTTLSRCGLIVNYSKSCCRTPVREACGSWYYYGIDCRIVRLKFHKTVVESEWISLLESARLLYEFGFLEAGNSILSYLDTFLPIPSGFGWVPGPRRIGSSNVRYNSQLQRLEVRIPMQKGASADLLTGEVGLYSYFTGKGNHMAPHHNVTHVEWGWVDRV